jgi:hypothetical protein
MIVAAIEDLGGDPDEVPPPLVVRCWNTRRGEETVAFRTDMAALRAPAGTESDAQSGSGAQAVHAFHCGAVALGGTQASYAHAIQGALNAL